MGHGTTTIPSWWNISNTHGNPIKWVPTGTAGGDRIIHTIYNNTPNSMKAHGESPNPISMEEFKDVLLKAQSRCTGSVDLIDMSNLYNKPTYPQHKNYFTILITAVNSIHNKYKQ